MEEESMDQLTIDDIALAKIQSSFADESTLLPVVVQDVDTLEVLMLAYLNKTALDLTISTGRGTYFSRSRDEIWVKGESSGHRQWVRSISFDCDSDALLFLVHQEGVACHTGEMSCFHNKIAHSRD
jgi:phosphoribosyl-AMP cyclohydrolase